MGYSGRSLTNLLPSEESISRVAYEMTDRAGDFLLERVKLYTPVANPEPGDVRKGRAPGTLRAAWRRTPVFEAGGGSWSVEVFSLDGRLAVLVEYPTRPHIIRPRDDREAASVVETGRPRGTVQDGRAALRFFKGGVVYARVVHHPGTKGARMMGKAIDDLRRADLGG